MIVKEILTSRIPKVLTQLMTKRSVAKTSQYPRPEKKHYRLWAVPGDLVLEKEILAKQFTVKWHPGLNTGIDHNRWIYALCDGVMVITDEEYKPDWGHPLVKEIYMRDEKQRAPTHMHYIHVIPKRRVSEFKLIDVV